MLLILVSVYLQRPKIDFPDNIDSVLQHEQENATFSRASCKIVVIRNLYSLNSLLSDDQAFSRYAECLGLKLNKRHENVLYIEWWASCLKRTFIISPL